MKRKVSIVPKHEPVPKQAPDGTIYIYKGQRVRITLTKQHPPVQAGDPEWMREIREKGNQHRVVVRISDGYELWGVKIEELETETDYNERIAVEKKKLKELPDDFYSSSAGYGGWGHDE